MSTIIEDTRQQMHDGDKHAAKHAWWQAHGVEVVRRKLDFGDYMAEGSNIAVDTKRDAYELFSNLGSGYRRVSHECQRAADAGYRLYFLCEFGARWADPEAMARKAARVCETCWARSGGRCDPCDPKSVCVARGARRRPFQGYQAHDRMQKLSAAHGCVFRFCERGDAARIICDLLGVAYE